MPQLFIRATNQHFQSCDEGAEYDGPERALALGVQGAIAIIAEEVNKGERSLAIEVSIEGRDGAQLLRSVVAVSVSPLISVAQGLK